MTRKEEDHRRRQPGKKKMEWRRPQQVKRSSGVCNITTWGGILNLEEEKFVFKISKLENKGFQLKRKEMTNGIGMQFKLSQFMHKNREQLSFEKLICHINNQLKYLIKLKR